MAAAAVYLFAYVNAGMALGEFDDDGHGVCHLGIGRFFNYFYFLFYLITSSVIL